MKRFDLDAEQADAILELKLYRLARLEILVIQNELADKRKRARQITGLLKDEEGRWKRRARARSRRSRRPTPTRPTSAARCIEAAEEVEFTADDFIVEEDNVVIVSRDGWVKRQKEVRDLSTTRLREGDSVLAVLPGSTRATVVFFTNFGAAYTVAHHRRAGLHRLRRAGAEAVQAARRRAGDRRVQPRPARGRRHQERGRKASRRQVHAIAVTSDGYSLRFGLEPFVEAEHARRPAVRAAGRGGRGRRRRQDHAATRRSSPPRGTRARSSCQADEVNYLSGPGKGVILIKLASGRGPGARLHRLDRRPRSDARRNEPRRRSRRSAPRSTRSPAAAAKGASCCSAASSRA